MRIVGGTLRGRTFNPPTSLTTRPMMDRVRQALFNVLEHRDWGKHIGDLFEGDLHVLDAFCGTGALAFETISRGAVAATLFDKDAGALKVARQNAASLGIADRCTILAADATQPPRFIGRDCSAPPNGVATATASFVDKQRDCSAPPNGVATATAQAPCKLIFLAPPYRKGLIPPSFAALDAAGWIAPHAVIVAETAKEEPLEPLPGTTLILARAYGEPMLHFLTR
jgi:16S rRNA (guanine966-N2)-methyltransferase